MKRRLLPTLITLSVLTGCAGLSNGRNFLTDSGEGGSLFDPRSDFPIVSGDSGRMGFDEDEFESRMAKTPEEIERDRTTMALERELAELENAQTEGNADLYNENRHKFQSTSEKIYFLNLPTSERRSFLISKGFIKEQKYHFNDQVRDLAVRHSDIVMGMNKSDVMNSWGRPVRVEVAGNPSYENERWAYQVNGATKYIYFEGGRVEGWE